MTATRVYRLDITFPPGSQESGWEPPGWRTANTDNVTGEFHGNPDGFTWPARRHYLSAAGAHVRKRLLEEWGAKVTIAASDPVTWPGGAA